MRALSSVFTLFLLVLLVSCAPQVQQVPEKVVEKVIVQCWDGSTASSIQDCPVQTPIETKPIEDETPPPISTETPPPAIGKTKMQELLDKAPTTYWFSDGQIGVAVQGTKRSTGFWYDQYWNYFYRLMYWDIETKSIYVNCCEIEENWWNSYKTKEEMKSKGMKNVYLPAFFNLNFTGDKNIDKTKIPIEFNKYWYDAKESELIRLFEPFYVKSPVDLMKEYATNAPAEIDTTTQILSWAGGSVESSLSIKFSHKAKLGQFIVFRFDNQFHLPLVIDELDKDGKLVTRTSYDFDTVYGKQGAKNVKLSDAKLTIPENSIIVTPKDYEKWIDYIEGD